MAGAITLSKATTPSELRRQGMADAVVAIVGARVRGCTVEELAAPLGLGQADIRAALERLRFRQRGGRPARRRTALKAVDDIPLPANRVRCDLCGRSCANAHGLRVHKARAHGERSQRSGVS